MAVKAPLVKKGVLLKNGAIAIAEGEGDEMRFLMGLYVITDKGIRVMDVERYAHPAEEVVCEIRLWDADDVDRMRWKYPEYPQAIHTPETGEE